MEKYCESCFEGTAKLNNKKDNINQVKSVKTCKC